MKNNLKLIGLLAIAFSLISSSGWAAGPYYVKSTGGTCGGASPQCTGLSTAAYPGSGTNQACACKLGEYVLGWTVDGSSGGQAGILAGGETMIYLDDTPTGFATELCSGGESYGYYCNTRPIPSGTAGNPTKIYGANYASCNNDYSNTTKVWGRERAKHIYDLAGSDYIELKCLEITDKSSCVYNVVGQAQDGTSSYVCNRSGSYPRGDHADTGIRSATGTTSNITLDHVNIHGLLYAVLAQKKQDWTLNYVKMNFNSLAGWDNDLEGDGVGTPNHDEGVIGWTNVEMKYNGCGEVWTSPGTPYYCTSQDQSGYGDAQGTGGGNNANYTFRDVTFAHNVSDDIDNLYDDGTTTTMKVINGSFQGSSGQSIKSAAKTTYVENVTATGNCGYFKEQSFTTFSSTQAGRSGTNCDHDGICDDNENSVACVCNQPELGCGGAKGDCPRFNDCRAGSVVAFANKTGGQKFYIKNSTLYSNGDTTMNMTGGNNCDANTQVDIRNSYFIQGIEFNDGADKANFFYADDAGGTCHDGTFTNLTGDNNWIINSKTGSYNTGYFGGSTVTSSSVSRFVGPVPLNTSYITDADARPNFYLTAATNDADETVTCQGNCSIDFQNYSRGASWDIGAIEYGSTPSEPPASSPQTNVSTSGKVTITGGRFQ